MRSRVAFLICAALLLVTPIFADAGATFYGDTTFGPTFNRPFSLVELSLTGTAVRYSVQPFFPNGNADCLIHSVQEGNEFDGHVALYAGSFNPASPLTNLIAVNDDGTLGIGTSEIPSDPADESIPLLFNTDYYLVTSGYNNADFGTFTNHIECSYPATRVVAGNGILPTYDGRVAELQGGRFQVYVTWENFTGGTGFGTSVPMGSTDSALFWFFQPANWELLVKVINGCGSNGNFWVFAAATTNVEFTLTIIDTLPNPDVAYTRFNPLGTQLNTSIADIYAFATCP